MIRAETYTPQAGWKSVRKSRAIRITLSDGTAFEVEETNDINGPPILRVRGLGVSGVMFIKPEAANSITIRSGRRP